MLRAFLLVLAALAILLSSGGCAGLKIDVEQTADCFLECLKDTIWVVNAEGIRVPVIPEDYRLLIWDQEAGQFEFKDKR